MFKGAQSSIVLLMMVMAIILAVGFLLIISILYHRSGDTTDLPPASLPNNVVQVEGQWITLQVPIDQQPMIVVAPPVDIVVEAAPEPQIVPTEPVVQPTAVPQTSPDVPIGLGGQPANHVMFISYIVQPGDTLYSIQRNHITSIALMAKHGIDADDIVVGNVLSLPVGNPAACTPWRPYVLLQGDTAFGLSRAYGTTLADLQARNGLDANYTIYETQVICVP